MSLIPDINRLSSDISQIYSDVEAQLIAYSTDITKLTPKEIEDSIKQINRASLQDERLRKYIGNNGYCTVNNQISGNNVKLLDKRKVEDAMQRLSEDMYELVQSSETMDTEEYLRRAIGLKYRFVRIHPFPDSNGRTSRALLNMMTIPKGILINVPKEDSIKKDYIRALQENNNVMDSMGYLQAIEENSEDLTDMEITTEMPLYDFIKKQCFVDLGSGKQSEEPPEFVKDRSVVDREI